jgi:hypothetical protein
MTQSPSLIGVSLCFDDHNHKEHRAIDICGRSQRHSSDPVFKVLLLALLDLLMTRSSTWITPPAGLDDLDEL